MERIFYDIENSEEEDENSENRGNAPRKKKYIPRTCALLFLIDVRKKMFTSELSDEGPALLACLKCVRNTIRHKIFNEEKCHCGIILMGTKSKNNPLNLGNLTIIQELNLIESDHILKVDELMKAIENSSYEKTYGFDNFSLGDVFWLATHILYNSKSQTLNKVITFFTNDDNPISTERNDFNRALATAQDMYRNFIILNFIALGKDFDGSKFYKKLLQVAHQDADYPIPDPVTNSKEMEQRTKKTNYKHMSLTRLPFVIGDSFTIGVAVMILIRKMKVPFKVKLSKATNDRVTTKLQLFETVTGSVVNEDNIIKSQSFGQKSINFSMKELKYISEYGKTEMKLLGFKPKTTISLENFVKPCAFIYPDESVYKGSSVFFSALLNRCIEKQVLPICTLTLRPRSVMRFVALIPQNENLKIGDGKEVPQGFIALFLPFAEEIRTFDDTENKKANPDQVATAMKLIKKLKFKYDVECFSNPRLKTHWAAVEALALNLPEAEEVNDSTCPNYELISHRVGDLANEFMNMVYDNDYDPEICGAPRKPRSSAPATSGPKINIENVELLVRKGKGETLPNDVLKAYLKSVGEGRNLSKVKKSDLLDKIRNFLQLN